MERYPRRRLAPLVLTPVVVGLLAADLINGSRTLDPHEEITPDVKVKLDAYAEQLVEQGSMTADQFHSIDIKGKKYDVAFNLDVGSKVLMYISYLYGGEKQVDQVFSLIQEKGLTIKEKESAQFYGEFLPPENEGDGIIIYIESKESKDYFQSVQKAQEARTDDVLFHEEIHMQQYGADPANDDLKFQLEANGIIFGIPLVLAVMRARKKFEKDSDEEPWKSTRRKLLSAAARGAIVGAFAVVQMRFVIEPLFEQDELEAYMQAGQFLGLPIKGIMSDNSIFAETKGKLFTYTEQN